jgi:hypothetical protein
MKNRSTRDMSRPEKMQYLFSALTATVAVIGARLHGTAESTTGEEYRTIAQQLSAAARKAKELERLQN